MGTSMQDRYVASMVLAATGDAMGFKNEKWEFCFNGETIQNECEQMGGIEGLRVSLPQFRVSDDTVMHLATAEALIEGKAQDEDGFYKILATKYKECMNDMKGRAEGRTCSAKIRSLKPLRPKGWEIPFDSRGGGCGGAMRAMCIGLRYPRAEDLDDLVRVSCESGRMSHHHPTGYLGALAAALFTAYAIQGKPVREWGAELLATLPRAKSYIKSQGRDVEENLNAWDYFTQRWEKYLTQRGIRDKSEPKFPDKYGVKERDAFYKSVSFSGWGGSSGHDAPMIAYDALLASGNDWIKLCKHGMLHGGDNDSTGTIAGACFGAMYGFEGVPDKNHKKVEYRDRLVNCGTGLYTLAHDTST